MGLVAEYVGFRWALALYAIDFVLIFILGRIAFKAVPGEPVGLIMEMPKYRMPSLGTTVNRSWFKLRAFVYEAFPLMVVGNMVIILADMVGLLTHVQGLMSPVVVGWLGLPAAAGVVLVFGVLRKELTLILLATLMGTGNFAAILTPAGEGVRLQECYDNHRLRDSPSHSSGGRHLQDRAPPGPMIQR
jgi:ferrous iron transport protein B